jgi:hypothetical protein
MRDKVKINWLRDKDRVDEASAKDDMKWLNRHVDGLNVRITALFGLDAAYLNNKNFKTIKRALKDIQGVTNELKKVIQDEIQNERNRR